MSYVDRVLLSDEVVLARTAIHWFIYLRAIFAALLAAATAVASFWVPAEAQLYVQIAAGAIAFIALWLWLGAWARRSSTELAVTNRRVIHKTGFLSRSTREMNREKVESVDVQQSISGRIFGYGTILVRGVGSSWEPFSHIADPLAFRSSITAT